jgi:hypothetical protein
MTYPAELAAPVARIEAPTVEAFVSQYLEKNRPIIVTGAMSGWKALSTWEPARFAREFGNERVQVYGDLFKLANIVPLSHYLEKYFGRNGALVSAGRDVSVPYVRWYCHLSAESRVPWADEVFDRLATDWARPAFFPSDSFVLPFCRPGDSIDPSRDWFPARGLFISAQGARTRLHADPWCSDALLCQVYGKKDFVMYEPSQAPHLVCEDRTVDVESPDSAAFPTFGEARIAVRDTLVPGDILLVPAGWYHHFNTATDSISLTWNFVHESRRTQFLAYLERGPRDTELAQLAYAYFHSPGHRLLDNADSIASLLKTRG